MTGSKSGILGKRLWRIPAIVIVLVAIKRLIHLLTAAAYDLFRDELYFLACGQHLAWGYMGRLAPSTCTGQLWVFPRPSAGIRTISAGGRVAIPARL